MPRRRSVLGATGRGWGPPVGPLAVPAPELVSKLVPELIPKLAPEPRTESAPGSGLPCRGGCGRTGSYGWVASTAAALRSPLTRAQWIEGGATSSPQTQSPGRTGRTGAGAITGGAWTGSAAGN